LENVPSDINWSVCFKNRPGLHEVRKRVNKRVNKPVFGQKSGPCTNYMHWTA